MARALVVFSLLFSASALACATCGQGGTANDPNQTAYKMMTIIMSLTPLIAIGGVILWIFWRVRQAERAEQPQPEPLPSPPAAPATAQVQQQNASA
jgi:hypothetical protein